MIPECAGATEVTPYPIDQPPPRDGAPDGAGQFFAAPAVLPAEIGFLSSHGVRLSVLRTAAARAQAEGISPDAALLADGTLSESFFYRAFARQLGVAFVEDEGMVCATPGDARAIRSGAARLAGHRAGRLVVAPQGATLVTLLQAARAGSLPPLCLSITTPSNLSREIRKASAEVMAFDASHGLACLDASLSARAGLGAMHYGLAAGIFLSVILTLAVTPQLAPKIFSIGTSCLFLPTIILRLFAGAACGGASRPGPRLADHRLPPYSIVVALHREARVARQLIAAIDAIDYPRAKLDIKLVLEEDDLATKQALDALNLGPAYEIIVAPAGAPRTKPRALNVALPLLRGTFVAVFDAEDVPDPSQLREAAERFERAPRTLACLQACLAIDNIDDSWLTRLFALEYAVLFDVLHQGMAGLQLPIPLGGSSNHFRTNVLRKVGGWDAWNVTEDADLGLRLARFGYRTATIASSTREEAPAFLATWLKQRRRWSKGWMQTFVTLSRNPRRLLRELGLVQTFVLIVMMTALVIVPLFWPLFTGFVIHDLVTSGLPAPVTGFALIEATLWISVVLFGAGSTIWLALLGMRRRKLLGLWPYLPLILPYYCLMSVAAWASLYDLIMRPHHWHKTEHGLARSSRGRNCVSPAEELGEHGSAAARGALVDPRAQARGKAPMAS
jgi:cellulose synthase/poly-beta-1,6-N-acetylglucosamine synthase-like glycosyltransferase